jgi:1-acyl-sn-glycerol-3-phosphate acyltransferase
MKMGVPPISAPMLKFFRRIVLRYVRRHFHGVRLSGLTRVKFDTNPLIIYANHSSWWDPMVSILLAGEFMPERSHYAPMDSEALARYRILRKVGIFPVEMKSLRGAAQFLRTGEAIVESGGVLWVTPQGRFVDSRVRPLEFKPGLATLAARVSSTAGACTVLPLAIEYPFWDERLPEVLLNFGVPVSVASGEAPEELETRLVEALDRTMVELCELAVSRNSGVFTTLSKGAVGVGGVYAFGKRLKALLLQRPYRGEHTLATSNEVEPAVRE